MLTDKEINHIKDELFKLGYTHKEIWIEMLDHICSHIEENYQPERDGDIQVFTKKMVLSFPKEELKKIAKSLKNQIDRMVIKKFISQFKSFFVGRNLIYTATILAVLWAIPQVFSGSLQEVYRYSPVVLSLIIAIISHANYFIKDYEGRYNSMIIERGIAPSIFNIFIFGNLSGIISNSLYLNGESALPPFYMLFSLLVCIAPICAIQTYDWAGNHFKDKYLAIS